MQLFGLDNTVSNIEQWFTIIQAKVDMNNIQLHWVACWSVLNKTCWHLKILHKVYLLFTKHLFLSVYIRKRKWALLRIILSKFLHEGNKEWHIIALLSPELSSLNGTLWKDTQKLARCHDEFAFVLMKISFSLDPKKKQE